MTPQPKPFLPKRDASMKGEPSNRVPMRPARIGARWRASETGSTAVEFALIAPMFIALILIAIAEGVVSLAKSELDVATQTTAREIMTGQVTTSAQLQTALCANITGIFNCSQIMVNLSTYATLASMNTTTPTLTYNGNGTVSNSWNSNFGTAGSIMVMQVMYQFPVIAGPLFSLATQSNGSALLVSTAVFVNE